MKTQKLRLTLRDDLICVPFLLYLFDRRCDNSFGLLVARHFGLPEDVLSKAKRINEQYFNVEHLNDAAQ